MSAMKTIFYGLIGVYAYSSNLIAMYEPSDELRRTAQVCRTNGSSSDTAVSIACRHLFYKALRDCGHPCPEHVMIQNDQKTMAGFTNCNNQIVPMIYFNEACWNNFPIGVRRIVALHEAMHIVKKPHLNSLDNEREADYSALNISMCKNCTLESAQWHFDESKKRGEAEYISLKEVEQLSDIPLNLLCNYVWMRSNMHKDTHPLDIERGLVRYLKLKEMGNALCDYHELEEVSKYLVNNQSRF